NQGNYSVVASNSSGTNASSNAFLTVYVPPAITGQPQPLTVMQGSNATFSVTSSGIPSPGYQWQFNSSNIDLATGSSYTVSGAQLGNQGNYSVVVTNVAGSVTSSNAALTVLAPPVITNQPKNLTLTQGGSGIIVAGASGTAPLTYQWMHGGTNITGATNRGYSFSNIQSSQAGGYWVIVTNNYGAVTSAVATVTVLSLPVITGQPQSQSVAVGSNATFTVSATGGNLTYQWLFNTGVIGGATASSYTVSNAQTNNGGNYSVLVTNTIGSATSSNAFLTVNSTPFQFQSINVLSNGAVQMTLVGVTGSNCCVNISSNMKDWVLLTNLANINGTIQFTDSTSTNNSSRFYRAQLVP
ncbi:MAG TPA: immunoglobulin domain-containing protein, partial [Verrucomicrobiae bacterium]|nr:immunoglobulin domain-containing protein [Verrucomicrobiae bacterium]